MQDHVGAFAGSDQRLPVECIRLHRLDTGGKRRQLGAARDPAHPPAGLEECQRGGFSDTPGSTEDCDCLHVLSPFVNRRQSGTFIHK